MDTHDDKEMRKRLVPAVTRAISILRTLGKANEPVGVNQIARDLELVPSTCLHILRVLVDEGLVSFDSATKRYAIDLGILPIARNALQRNNFVALVEKRLTDLSLKLGITGVATQISDPGHMVVVALSQAPLPFRLQVDLGSRFPLFISATGRCIAAFNPLPENELKKRFAALKWDNPLSFERWLAEVQDARQLGYAVDRGRYIAGVTILAVPIFDSSGRITQSIVTIGISEKVEAIGVVEVARQVLDMRNEIVALLSGASAVPGTSNTSLAGRTNV